MLARADPVVIAIAATKPEFAKKREEIYTKFAELCVSDSEIRKRAYVLLIDRVLPNCINVLAGEEGICESINNCVYVKARAELEEQFRKAVITRDEYLMFKEALRNIHRCIVKSADMCNMQLYYEVIESLGAQQLEQISRLLGHRQEEYFF